MAGPTSRHQASGPAWAGNVRFSQQPQEEIQRLGRAHIKATSLWASLGRKTSVFNSGHNKKYSDLAGPRASQKALWASLGRKASAFNSDRIIKQRDSGTPPAGHTTSHSPHVHTLVLRFAQHLTHICCTSCVRLSKRHEDARPPGAVSRVYFARDHKALSSLTPDFRALPRAYFEVERLRHTSWHSGNRTPGKPGPKSTRCQQRPRQRRGRPRHTTSWRKAAAHAPPCRTRHTATWRKKGGTRNAPFSIATSWRENGGQTLHRKTSVFKRGARFKHTAEAAPKKSASTLLASLARNASFSSDQLARKRGANRPPQNLRFQWRPHETRARFSHTAKAPLASLAHQSACSLAGLD